MTDRLEARLRDLGRAVAYPEPSGGLAAAVGRRIADGRPEPSAWRRLRGLLPVGSRPVRRGVLVALAAILLLAAAVAAAGIMLPGLRIVFVTPGSTAVATDPPSASAPVTGPLGSALGLGAAMDLGEAERIAGFDLLVPAGAGAPDEVFTLNRRVTMVWRAGRELPEIATTPGIGLLVTEFRGSVDPGYYEKLVDAGASNVESVRVGGLPGYWLDGAPHQLLYRDASGAFIEETRRMVGEVLIWRRGELTLRIESALGRAATIALAESLASSR